MEEGEILIRGAKKMVSRIQETVLLVQNEGVIIAVPRANASC
jgi:hypothetical protein